MDQIIARQPKGIPAGGQFAEHDRNEGDVSLHQSAFDKWASPAARLADAGWRATMHAIDIVDRTVNEVAPSGSRIVLTRRHGEERFQFDRVEVPPGAQKVKGRNTDLRAQLNQVVAEASPEWLDFALDRFDDSANPDAEEYGFRVGQSSLRPYERVALHIDRVADEAGLTAVAPPLFDVLIDRLGGSEGGEARLAAYAKLTTDDLTDLYVRIIGPAIDDLDQEVDEVHARNEGAAQ